MSFLRMKLSKVPHSRHGSSFDLPVLLAVEHGCVGRNFTCEVSVCQHSLPDGGK